MIQARGGVSDSDRLSASARIASYLLWVSEDGVVEIVSNGLTSGATANDPSFTWTVGVSGGLSYLYATPVGSTSGTFYLEATAVGALLLY